MTARRAHQSIVAPQADAIGIEAGRKRDAG
jgi:hypothetical protein